MTQKHTQALLGRIDKRGNLHFPTLTGDFNAIYSGIGIYLKHAAAIAKAEGR